MANEYLTRTPTSTGNRKVFTISFWIKNNVPGGSFFQQREDANTTRQFQIKDRQTQGYLRILTNNDSGVESLNDCEARIRDYGGWQNIIVATDTTDPLPEERIKIYVNGKRRTDFVSDSYDDNPSENFLNSVNDTVRALIGIQRPNSSATLNDPANAQYSDFFLVDGQALTPDVFGFHKDGDGYMSSGTTQATDFRPGQWMPHAPTKIKKDINRRGGFGVNGFYLPMNDSSNPGADFHCDPNSIITLKGEDLPQPRNGAPTTTDAFVSQLRSDPFAANLVLAVPGITGGQGSGYGDYSADIKGSGTNKTLTANGNAGIAVTASYYGSAMTFDGDNATNFSLGDDSDFAFGTDDFTIEFWRNRNSVSDSESYFAKYGGGAAANNSFWFGALSSGRDSFYWYDTDGDHSILTSNNSMSVNQFDHLCAERHNGTVSLYVNGVSVGISTLGALALNTTAYNVKIGANDDDDGTTYYPFDGEIQDLRVYKGVAKYKGGFDVPKPYTPVGIESWRTTADTCKNNFATLSPLSYQTTGTYGSSYPVLSNGNLTFTHGTTGQWERSNASFGVGEGKWYYEFQIVTRAIFVAPDKTENWAVGVRESDSSSFYGESDGFEDLGDHLYWIDAGTAKIVSNEDRTAGATSGILSVVNGDIINIAFEKTATALKVWFGKNGTYFNSGNPATGANPAVNHATTTEYIIPAAAFYQYSGQVEPVGTFNFGQNPSFSGQTTAGTNADDSGKGLFKYAPPTGFLALCEDNLPAPAIADPGKYFKTVLYTGDGSSGRSITGVGFQPDLIWLKNRSSSNFHVLCDSVRGPGNLLFSNSDSPEDNYSGGTILSFDSDGYSANHNSNANSVNISGGSIVAWCWKAGGAAVSNSDGSITSQVSANQTAGFSIVSYTGTGANATVGHGLNKTPKFIITKQRTTAGHHWRTYHSSIGATKSVYLNLTNAETAVDAGFMNSTEPTTSVFSIGIDTNLNENTQAHIAYCWAEIEGFSKFGSYVGNNDDDGPFVYCGFKPAWVIVKRITTGGNEPWTIFDSSRGSTNPNPKGLYANDSAIENDASGRYKDFLSNGFKIRGTSGEQNTSGITYIFMAFAESPFQTANSK